MSLVLHSPAHQFFVFPSSTYGLLPLRPAQITPLRPEEQQISGSQGPYEHVEPFPEDIGANPRGQSMFKIVGFPVGM